MITIDEAAVALRLTPRTLHKYARQNMIPAFKVGRNWCFDSVEAVTHALSIQRGNKLQQARLRGRIS